MATLKHFAIAIVMACAQSLSALTVTYTDIQPKEQIVQQVLNDTQNQYGSFYSAWVRTLKGEDPVQHVLKKLPGDRGTSAGDAFAIQRALYTNPGSDPIEASFKDSVSFSTLQVMTSELAATLEKGAQLALATGRTATVNAALNWMEQVLRDDFVTDRIPDLHLTANLQADIDLSSGLSQASDFLKNALNNPVYAGKQVTADVDVGGANNDSHTLLLQMDGNAYVLFDSGQVIGTYRDLDMLIQKTLGRVRDKYVPGQGWIQLIIYSN